MCIRPSQLHRILFIIALLGLWSWGAITLWLQAFYQLAPEPIRVHAKDKQARTFLDREVYSLYFSDAGDLKPINTTQSRYMLVHEGDAACYSYNSLFGRRINFQHRPCEQTDSYSPIQKLLNSSEN